MSQSLAISDAQPRRASREVTCRFAVIADTHVNAHDDSARSPWGNVRSNARARAAISYLNALEPDFVVHLGDLLHPTPQKDDYRGAVEHFRSIVDGLHAPLYVLPGNHDVGDKPGDWLPAASVSAALVDAFRGQFGDDRFVIDRAGLCFIGINAQLINSGLSYEREHATWLERTLRRSAGRRIFVFSHYPPFVFAPDEEGHYDNLDEPGRAWLLQQLAGARVEGLFTGHVHTFLYNRHAEMSCYGAPSLSFVRHDYSELFRVAPDDEEYGRGDIDKLGFMLVDVTEAGHDVRVIRTALAAGREVPGDARARRRPSAVVRQVGVDARQAWNEVAEIPYAGALDEFSRKTVRNDYPLMALREIGVTVVRIPVHDAVDRIKRNRMAALGALGQRFRVFSYGLPSPAQVGALRECRETLDSLEIILPPARTPGALVQLARLRAATGVPVFLGELQSPATDAEQGPGFHGIRHGFRIDSPDRIAALTELPGFGEAVDGLAFATPRSASAWDDPLAAATLARAHHLLASSLVNLRGENPAVATVDDASDANRVAEAVAASHVSGGPQIFLDTFADVDRGYFPRLGLTDRRYNLRVAGSVAKHLHHALNQLTSTGITPTVNREVAGGRMIEARAHNGSLVTLILPRREGGLDLADHGTRAPDSIVIDLITGTDGGERNPSSWSCGGPTLIVTLGPDVSERTS